MYFAMHLKKMGYAPVVLTVSTRSAAYAKLDPTLNSLVANIETHRVRFRNPLGWYSFFTKGDFRTGVPQGQVEQKSLFQKIAGWVRANLFVPDARKGWVMPAYRKAISIIEQYDPGVIITTGPPHSTHLIGSKLKDRFAIPWLADFRDPWTDLFYLKSLPRRAFAIQKDQKLERQVLQAADAVITTTAKNFHQQLQKKAAKTQKFYTLYNGFDASLFAQNDTKPKNEKFTIVFSGLLTEHQAYPDFLQSLSGFLLQNPNSNSCCVLVGSIAPKMVAAFARVIPTTNLGYVSHQQAIVQIQQADLLVNFSFEQAGQSSMVSGKLFEYMATRKPILNLGDPQSEAAELLSHGAYNRCIAPTDHISQMQFLTTVYEAWHKDKPLLNDTQKISAFSRASTTKGLIQILDGL